MDNSALMALIFRKNGGKVKQAHGARERRRRSSQSLRRPAASRFRERKRRRGADFPRVAACSRARGAASEVVGKRETRIGLPATCIFTSSHSSIRCGARIQKYPTVALMGMPVK